MYEKLKLKNNLVQTRIIEKEKMVWGGLFLFFSFFLKLLGEGIDDNS